MAEIQPYQLDFKDIRSSRQKNNDITVYQNIKNNDKKLFYKNINTKELDRTLEFLNMNFEQFWTKCIQDDDFCKLSARHISKCASRQGSKDETEQIKICNLTTEKFGVKITNLSAKAYRPTKDGKILSNEEMKQNSVKMDCCLKSFDASIEGKMKGYITAKVALGSGGHQDNVFEEMDTIAEWWTHYKKNTQEYLVLLIDTDLQEKFNRIKEKYNKIDNILVFNHFDFQKYMITNYSSESI
tara:strand:+ start:1898 stop:2620 length:723 start_codon:yes stop_codon:yes gene_type:complete